MVRGKIKSSDFKNDKDYFNFINEIFNNTNDMDIAQCNEGYYDEDEGFVSTNNDKPNAAIDINDVKLVKFSSKPELSFNYALPFVKMEDSYEGYFTYCSELNHIAYRFQKANGFHPTIFRFDELISSGAFTNGLFEHYDIPSEAFVKLSFQGEDKTKLSYFLIAFKKDLVLIFDGVNDGALFYNIQYEKDENSMLYTVLGLLKNWVKPKVSKNKIYIVYRNQHGFEKMGFDIKKTKVDLNENYNNGFVEMSENILRGLNDKNKTNLVILSGEPGTGKTTYVRYLTSKLKKNIIFISPDMVDSITDPAFIPFLMKNNDSILIIEDAEPALEKRNNGGRSSAVSNVLNLTDGLLSDCLKISIVATFNTDKKTLDDALLRKGRLLMNYKFDKLCVEKSKVLLDKLGHKEVEVKEPMTLSDIYYYGTDNNVNKKDKKIGFLQ
jgi:hypothetical protein